MAITRSGCFEPDLERLAAIDPALFATKPDDTTRFWRQQIVGLLMHGDTQPALVVAKDIVAAYSDDLDAVVLLRIPSSVAQRPAVGERLVTVNSYTDVYEFEADDIVKGPKSTGKWGNVTPLIVAFANSQTALQARRLQQIGAHEWRALDAALARRRERFGDARVRDARPTQCALPVPPSSSSSSSMRA